ncbi:MAG TPA: ABC transporter ATP-binding protein, partial [Ohtaekwangia sp.]|nr:ABC transporter ATP-binding protein [Ohtaekwangia sp.]
AYEALRDFFQNGFIYFYSFGKFFFSFGAMLYFSPLFGSLAVIIGMFTIFLIIKFDKPFLKSLKEVNEREHEVSSTLFDSLSNIISVITLRLESRIQKSFMAKVAEIFPPFRRNAVINEWKWFTAQMMVGLIYCVITIGYVYQNWIPGEPFLIGGLVILLGYVNQFTSVFNDIASQYTQIIKQHTELQNVNEIEETYAQRGVAHTEKLSQDWNSIDIEHLNFTRTDARSDRPTGIKDINIRIAKGQRIALIGESGSGKSTLLSVLRGLYTPESNVKATLDNGSEIAFQSISNSVMLFPQDPEIFENTIRYNITLGLPFTEAEIMEACETARFTDVVKQLPQGLETHIQEKGVNLSGGQKQRLALARGILAARSNDIVLMDEPTSSVDPRTERLLYGNLFKTLKHKAVVSSLHRLHLLTQFDYVYILKNGEIVEAGTFEELKRRSLVFKELWDHQDEKFSATETPAFPEVSLPLPISAAL